MLFTALMAATSAAAEAQMLKISMVMSSADKVVASPTIVVANGATGSVEIGDQGFVGAMKTKAILAPTIHADGTILMPVIVKLTTEGVVDDKPQISTREMTMQLKAQPGKKFALTVPTHDDKAPFSMSVQVDLLTEDAIAVMRTANSK
jgi:hypothetical protein